MKNISLIAILFLSMLNNTLLSQIDFGIKLGVHSFELSDPTDIIFPNNEGSIKFSDAKLGFQGGIYTKINFAGFFLEPRLMLHSTNVEYIINDSDDQIIDVIKEESFTNLDIPLLVGFKVLFLDAMLGPVAHLNLDHASDLFDFDGYDERFKTATYGWRAGLGFTLGNVNLGLEYEGNFSEFGDHVTVGGEDFNFSESPKRLIFNVGIKLF
ncbi:MAG: outer membrane beta-barrel protein [Saprospiraceae bacterium]|nr:outer membrane beta-barrel protein [Bacteroidia bacterium]MBT8228884.1 outer membrane beta-barrel protein [Bacteroidia bacterium]NNF21696.1 outer membrane beta-barrel protein [Saprospiraceae bacterium]NNK90004.1 outer membrane beta-barrel protein [Saprospiraceae bacterium]